MVFSSTSSTTRAKQQKRLTSFFRNNEDDGDDDTGKQPSKRQAKKQKQAPSSFLMESQRRQRRPAGSSGFGVCPMCQCSFPWHTLERHAANCDGSRTKTTTKRSAAHHDEDDQEEKKRNAEIIQQADTKKKTTTSASATTLERKTEMTNVASHSADSDNHQGGADNFPFGVNAGTAATTTIQQQQPQLSYSQPIPGLFVYENFLTEEEETAILQELDDDNNRQNVLPKWKPTRFNGKSLGKRWGVHCNLRDRRVDAPQHPLPQTLQDIVLPKLAKLLKSIASSSNTNSNGRMMAMMMITPNEANAIDYRRRQGHWLKAHVDDRALSKEPIANLSLAGDCYMTYQNQAPHRNLCVSQEKVLLKRRTLQILTGKARYDFSHGIANDDLLSDRRVSVTMRESPLTMKKMMMMRPKTTK